MKTLSDALQSYAAVKRLKPTTCRDYEIRLATTDPSAAIESITEQTLTDWFEKLSKKSGVYRATDAITLIRRLCAFVDLAHPVSKVTQAEIENSKAKSRRKEPNMEPTAGGITARSGSMDKIFLLFVFFRE